MFIVGSLLMLLTSLTFVVGGNMEKLCQPLIDLTIFSEVCINDSWTTNMHTLGPFCVCDLC